MEQFIGGIIGLALGALLAWLALRSRTAGLQARLTFMEKELAGTKTDLARLLLDQRQFVESRARLESALESGSKAGNDKKALLTRARGDLQKAVQTPAAHA